MRHGGGGQFWKVRNRYIADIHDKDTFGYSNEELIGKKIYPFETSVLYPSLVPGYMEGFLMVEGFLYPFYFYAVKILQQYCIERRR